MDGWIDVASISFLFLNNLFVIYPLAYIQFIFILAVKTPQRTGHGPRQQVDDYDNTDILRGKAREKGQERKQPCRGERVQRSQSPVSIYRFISLLCRTSVKLRRGWRQAAQWSHGKLISSEAIMCGAVGLHWRNTKTTFIPASVIRQVTSNGRGSVFGLRTVQVTGASLTYHREGIFKPIKF